MSFRAGAANMLVLNAEALGNWHTKVRILFQTLYTDALGILSGLANEEGELYTYGNSEKEADSDRCQPLDVIARGFALAKHLTMFV